MSEPVLFTVQFDGAAWPLTLYVFTYTLEDALDVAKSAYPKRLVREVKSLGGFSKFIDASAMAFNPAELEPCHT